MSSFHFGRKYWLFQLGFSKRILKDSLPPNSFFFHCSLTVSIPWVDQATLGVGEWIPFTEYTRVSSYGGWQRKTSPCFHTPLFSESTNIRIKYVFEADHPVLCLYNFKEEKKSIRIAFFKFLMQFQYISQIGAEEEVWPHLWWVLPDISTELRVSENSFGDTDLV